MRNLVWLEESGLLGCSECAWVFRPRGSPKGKSPEEMLRDFESQRDEAFASHLCAEHPRKSTPEQLD
jgi:hypothetical protein